MRLLASAYWVISKQLGDSRSSGGAATSDVAPAIADIVIGHQSSGLSGRRGALCSAIRPCVPGAVQVRFGLARLMIA